MAPRPLLVRVGTALATAARLLRETPSLHDRSRVCEQLEQLSAECLAADQSLPSGGAVATGAPGTPTVT